MSRNISSKLTNTSCSEVAISQTTSTLPIDISKPSYQPGPFLSFSEISQNFFKNLINRITLTNIWTIIVRIRGLRSNHTLIIKHSKSKLDITLGSMGDRLHLIQLELPNMKAWHVTNVTWRQGQSNKDVKDVRLWFQYMNLGGLAGFPDCVRVKRGHFCLIWPS